MFNFTIYFYPNTMDCHIVRLVEVGSTNQFALDLLAKGPVAEGTIIVTDKQTSGRGIEGNEWESEPGKNLTFSLVVYPDFLSADYQFYLNKTFSLGLYDVVRLYAGEQTRIKWPNDIYCRNGKIAGILVQNGIQGNTFKYCVAGIGLNVNQMSFSSIAGNPVSLKMVTAKDYNLDTLLLELCRSIWNRLEMLRRGQLETIDIDYLTALYRLNEPAGYIYKGREIQARIKGVSRYGHLVLEVPSSKIIECDLKEVKFMI